MDFKLGEDGDIMIRGGKFTLLDTIQEAVRQRLQITLNTFQGEWFLNTQFGIPYKQRILAKGLSKKEVDAIFIAEINKDPDVIKILYFSSTYNSLKRGYDLVFEVLTTDGKLRVYSPFQTPNDEVLYPTPPEFTIQPSCRNQGIMDGGGNIITPAEGNPYNLYTFIKKGSEFTVQTV